MVHLHIRRTLAFYSMFFYTREIAKTDFFAGLYSRKGSQYSTQKSRVSKRRKKKSILYTKHYIYVRRYILYYASIKLGSRLFCYNIFVDVGAIFPARAAPLLEFHAIGQLGKH